MVFHSIPFYSSIDSEMEWVQSARGKVLFSVKGKLVRTGLEFTSSKAVTK